MKEEVSRKKHAHNVMCWNNTENKRKSQSMKNKVRKAVSKAMRSKTEEALTEIKNWPNWMLRLVN